MNKQTMEFLTQKTNELINSGSVCKEAKEAAENWLKSVGTETEKEETAKYLKELEEDIEPIDDLIALLGTPLAAEYMGEEVAKAFLVHAEQRKAAGEKYCDCPACSAVCAILSKKDEILAD